MTREEILAMAEQRMENGRAKYGDFDQATDTRDLIQDRIEEQADAINYSIMDIQKLSHVRDVAGVKVWVANGRLSVSMKAIPEEVICPEA